MIYIRQLIIVAAISLTFLIGCNVSAKPQNITTANDKYEQLLVDMERAFNEKNIVDLDRLLIEVSYLDVIEIPTYERLFYQSALLYFNGEYVVAIEILNDFDLMLDIDMGRATCVSNNNIKKNKKVLYNKKVYNEMCWEAFLAYYGNNSKEVQQRLNRLQQHTNDLRIKLESISR